MPMMLWPACPTALWNLEHKLQARIQTPRECFDLPNDDSGCFPKYTTRASTYWQVGKKKVNSWGRGSSAQCLLICWVTHIWPFWTFIYKVNKNHCALAVPKGRLPGEWPLPTPHAAVLEWGRLTFCSVVNILHTETVHFYSWIYILILFQSCMCLLSMGVT